MSTLRFCKAWVIAAAVFRASPARCRSHAETVGSLRVMLHPYAAARGELPPEAHATLESIAGTGLTLTGTTRTGALDLALAAPVTEADADAMVKKLRVSRSVLWAEAIAPASVARKSAKADPNGDVQGRRIMVRLKDGVTVVWPEFLERLRKRLGMAVTLERQFAHIHVVSVSLAQSADNLAEFAKIIQTEPEVQYADPVKRARTFAVPNDPLYSEQWSMHGTVAGINVETAWALQPSTHGITVAVVDTGILPPSGPRRSRPARLRLHLRSRPRARRQRARPESARRRRLVCERVRRISTSSLARAVRRRPDRRQHQQRHRRRGHRTRREHPSGARARRVRRHVRGHPRRHDVGVRRRDRRAFPPTRRRRR